MWKALSGKGSESSSTVSSARRKASESAGSAARPPRSESGASTSSSRKTERKHGDRERDRDRISSSQYPPSRERDLYASGPRSSSGSFVTAVNTRAGEERASEREPRRSSTFPATMSTSARREEEDGWVDLDDVASDTTRRSKHRKRSSSRDRKHELRRTRSSSKEREEKRQSKKSSKSSKSGDEVDGRRSERSRGDTLTKADRGSNGNGEVLVRINSQGQKEQVRYAEDASARSISRDPNSQSSRMDSHVSSQFPGQDPTSFTSPYKPALNPAGGFGLAADYYGDQGQSVANQPGVRISTPVIAGTQPHLQSASAVPAPPQETGHGLAEDYYMSGGLGDSNSNNANTTSSANPSKPPRPNKPSIAGVTSSTPGKHSNTSGLAQSAGAAAAGAALGYTMSHQTTHGNGSSHATSQTNGTLNGSPQYGVGAQMPYQNTATFAAGGQHSQYDHSTSAPAVPTLGSTYVGPSSAKPSVKPGKSSTQHSNNLPLYAAAAGLAGVAAYEHHQHHNESHHSQHGSNTFGGSVHRPSGPYGYGPSYSQGGLGMKHKHQGPISRFVDWWKDYEDVQKMEEYTEYIGVCRYCFDPHSRAGDAPRQHHYHRRRSSDSLRGSRENLVRRSTDNLSATGRVDKTSRYERYDYSSDEGRRRRSKGGNWIAAGLGAYGLGKLGKTIFGSGHDFDDTYSVRTGRFNESSTSLHRKNSHGHGSGRSSVHRTAVGRSEYGLAGSEHSHDRKEFVAHRPGQGNAQKQFLVTHHANDHSRSRSRDRRSTLVAAGLGAAAGASVLSSSHRQRSKSPRQDIRIEKRHGSPERQFVRHHERESSPSMFSSFFGRSSPSPKRRGSRRHREKKGFFNFDNSSTSSTGSDLVYGSKVDLSTESQLRRRRSSLKRKVSTRNLRKGSHEDLNKTLLGIGATAAALGALSAHDRRKSKIHDIYTKPAGRTKVGKPAVPRKTSMSHHDHDSADSDVAWESASEAGGSESGASLAFGESDHESHVVKPRKSTESLASNESGVNILGWRFGSSGKRKRRSTQDLGRQYAPDEAYPGPVTVTGPSPTAYNPRQSTAGSVMSSTSNPPPMQHIPPEPISTSPLPPMQYIAPEPVQSADSPSLRVPDFNSPFHHRNSSIHLSPRHQIDDPMIVARPDPMPLQQPQPVKPVSPPKYAAPTGTPVFARETSGDVSRKTSTRKQGSRPPLPTMTEQVSPPRTTTHSGSFIRDATLAGAAGIGLASALSSSSSKTSKRRDTGSATAGAKIDSPTASQVRFDESRPHPERGDNGASRRERERSDEIARIEAERREREQARVRKRDEEVEARRQERERERRAAEAQDEAQNREREQRAADLARRVEKRERERREKEEDEVQNREREKRAADLARRVEMSERERREKEEDEVQNREREKRAADLARRVELRERERREKEKEEADRVERERKEAERVEVERQRQRELEREREKERRREEEERERERERERQRESDRAHDKWRDAAMAGVAGATVGAVVAGMRHSGSTTDRRRDTDGDVREDSRDRSSKRGSKSRKEERREERDEPAIIAQEVAPTEEIIPSNDHTSPVLDDELMDRDYFTKSRAGQSIDATIAGHDHDHHDLEYEDPDKEHEIFMQEFEDRMGRRESQSMAEFFSPPELHEPSSGKTAVAPAHFPEDEAFDPPGSDEPSGHHYPHAFTTTHYHDSHGPGSAAAAWIHHQIPELRIISATPPQSMRIERPSADTHVTEEDTTRSEVSSKAGGRSVTWGEDQTHVYTTVTPQASYESLASKDQDHTRDPAVTGSTPEPSHPEADFPVPDSLKQYVDDGNSRVDQVNDEEGVEEVMTPGVVVEDDGSAPNVFSYRTPWAETVSDLAGQMFSGPSSEDLRHDDGGFVEGEVFDETPKEERMPGGFDDYEEATSRPVVPPEIESRVEELPDTPKEEAREVEEDPEYFTTKKDKKKKDKSKKRRDVEEAAAVAAASAAVPLAAHIASDTIKEKQAEPEPEEEFERPLSKKEKKKLEKEKKRMSMDDGPQSPRDEPLEDSAVTAATMAAVSAAQETASKTVAEAQPEEDFERPLSKKEKKKKDKAKQRSSWSDEPPTPAEESSSQFAGGVTTEPEQYEEVQSKAGAPIGEASTISIPTNAFDDVDELAGAKTPKSKTKSKRRSGQYGSPTARSPLRSEISFPDEEFVSEQRDVAAEVPTPKEEDDLTSSRELTKTASRSSREERDGDRESRKSRKSSKDVDFVDDDTRSRTSEPIDDLDRKKERRRHSSRHDSPDDDSRSVAASEAVSEPAYFYETPSRKSKHRSRRDDDDDDARSAVSTPARWDDRDSKSSGKEKKGGIFGLFRSKSEEKTESKRSPKESPTESRFDDDEVRDDGEKKKKKKKKHRSSDGDELESVAGKSEVSDSRRSSKYDDDFDDVRSTTSSSSRKKEKRRSTGDTYSDKGKLARNPDPPAETVLRSPHDEGKDEKDMNPLCCINGTDDDNNCLHDRVLSGYKDLGQAHTASTKQISVDFDAKRDEYSNDKRSSKDESFLGDRGEELTGLPPLPVSFSQDGVATTFEDLSVDDLPELPRSRPDSPYGETPQRPPMQPRFSSSTAVPLRFRRPPGSPATRENVLLSSPAAASPTGPEMLQRRGSRPHSGDFSMHGNEIRPLYLLERNRKTPDPEEMEQLPSLPSSHTSSRASSVHDTDEYQSAQESPVETRYDDAVQLQHGYEIDAPLEQMVWDQQMQMHGSHDDILNSQQSTPTGPSFSTDVKTSRQELDDDEAKWLENTRRMQERAAQELAESHHGIRDATAAAVAGGVAAAISHQMISAAAEHSALESPNRETHQRSAPIQAPKPEMREDDPFTWEEIKTDDRPDFDPTVDATVDELNTAASGRQLAEPIVDTVNEKAENETLLQPLSAQPHSQPLHEAPRDGTIASQAVGEPSSNEAEAVATTANNDEKEGKKRILILRTDEQSVDPPIPSIELEPATAIPADEPSNIATIETPPATVIPEIQPAVKNDPGNFSTDLPDSNFDTPAREVPVAVEPSDSVPQAEVSASLPASETSSHLPEASRTIQSSELSHHDEAPTLLPSCESPQSLPEPPQSFSDPPQSLTERPTDIARGSQIPTTPQTPAIAGKDGFDATFEDMQPLTRTRSRKSVSWPDEQTPATPERPALSREESGLVKYFEAPKHEDADSGAEEASRKKKGKKAKKVKKGRKLSLGDEEQIEIEAPIKGTAEVEATNVPLPPDDGEFVEPMIEERQVTPGEVDATKDASEIRPERVPLPSGDDEYIEPTSEERSIYLDNKQDTDAPVVATDGAKIEPQSIPLPLDNDDELVEPAHEPTVAFEVPQSLFVQPILENVDASKQSDEYGQDVPVFRDPFAPSNTARQDTESLTTSEDRVTAPEVQEPSRALTEQQPDEPDLWTSSSNKKKKGKKNSKGRRDTFTLDAAGVAVGAVAGAVASKALGREESQEPPTSRGVDVAHIEEPQDSTGVLPKEEELPTGETPVRSEPEDEWAFSSTSKKGKKGKKAKKGSKTSMGEPEDLDKSVAELPTIDTSTTQPEPEPKPKQESELELEHDIQSEHELKPEPEPTRDVETSTQTLHESDTIDREQPIVSEDPLSKPPVSEQVAPDTDAPEQVATKSVAPKIIASEKAALGPLVPETTPTEEGPTPEPPLQEPHVLQAPTPEPNMPPVALPERVAPEISIGETVFPETPIQETYVPQTTVPETATSEPPASEGPAVLTPLPSETPGLDSAASEQQVQPEAEIDDWDSAPTKKSKKGKKGRKKSIASSEPETSEAPFDQTPSNEPPLPESPLPEPPVSEQPASEPPVSEQPASEPLASDLPSSELPASEQRTPESTAAEQQVEAETERDGEWESGSMKKSKKGKKGRKKSIAFSETETSEAPFDDGPGNELSSMPVPSITAQPPAQEPFVSDSPALESSAPDPAASEQQQKLEPEQDDEWGSAFTKKSKKGKKGQKQSTGSSLIEPETGEASFNELPSNEPSPMPEPSIPTESLASEPPVSDLRAIESPAPDSAAIEQQRQLEAERDDEWGPASTKKGKKGKKGRKQSSGPSLLEPETGEASFNEAPSDEPSPMPEPPLAEESTAPALPAPEPPTFESSAQEFAVSEQQQQLADEQDNEWGSVPVKKSKKGKKGRKQSTGSSLIDPETSEAPFKEVAGDEPPLTEPEGVDLTDRTIQEPSVAEPMSDSANLVQPSEEAQPEDDWSSSFMKKGKKGKKGKKASIPSVSPEPQTTTVKSEESESVVNTEAQPADEIRDTQLEPEPFAHEQVPQAEVQNEENPIQLRRGEETAEPATVVEPQPEPEQSSSLGVSHDAESSIPTSEEARSEDQIVESEPIPEPAPTATSSETVEPDVTAPAQPPQVEAEDEWSNFTTSKKGKKGKKGRKGSVPSESVVLETPGDEKPEESSKSLDDASEQLQESRAEETVHESDVPTDLPGEGDQIQREDTKLEHSDAPREPEPDDFFPISVSKKKKGKKGKRGSEVLPSPAEPDADERLATEPIDTEGQEAADFAATQSRATTLEEEPTTENLEAEQQTANSLQEANTDDFFSFVPTKKGKKGKKGKKASQPSTPADEFESQLPEDTTLPRQTSPVEESAGERAQMWEPVPKDTEDSPPSNLPPDRAEPEVTLDVETSREAVPDKNQETPFNVSDTPANDDAELSEKVPVVTNEGDPEDEWSSSFSVKKSKKGKKGKRASLVSTPQSDPAEEPQMDLTMEGKTDLPAVEPQAEEMNEPVPDDSLSVDKASREHDQAPEATREAEPEEDWSSFSIKKGKKGKKGKKSLPSTPPVLDEAESQTAFRFEDTPTIAEDHSRLKEGLTGFTDSQAVQNTEVEQSLEPPPADQDPEKSMATEQDDFVAFTTSKKGKKGKKGKRESRISTPTAESEPSVEPEFSLLKPDEGQYLEQPVIEEPTQPAEESPIPLETANGLDDAPIDAGPDDFAFSAPKAKKKGKKAKKNSVPSIPEGPGLEPPPTAKSDSNTRALDTGAEEMAPDEMTIDSAPAVRTDDVWDDTELLSQERNDAPQDAGGDDFWEFAPKPTKKGKKGKRASLASAAAVQEPTSRELEGVQEPIVLPSESLPAKEVERTPEPEISDRRGQNRESSQEAFQATSSNEVEDSAVVPLLELNDSDLVEPQLQSDERLEQPAEQLQETVTSYDHPGMTSDELTQKHTSTDLDKSEEGLTTVGAPAQQGISDEVALSSQEQHAYSTVDPEQTTAQDIRQNEGVQDVPKELTGVPEDKATADLESSSFADFSIKKTKKTKKKGKMSLTKLAIKYPSASAEELEAMLRKHNEEQEEAQAPVSKTPDIDKPESAEEAPPMTSETQAAEEPNPDTLQDTETSANFDEFTLSSKRSKKQKKREKEARKASLPFGESASADVPSAAVEEQMPSYFEPKPTDDDTSHMPVDEPQFSGDDQTNGPSADRAPTDEIAQSLQEHGVDVTSNRSQEAENPIAYDIERSRSPHDVDFAATVAAGLQESGFDPNLAIDDPSFHRRSSPPNAGPEADPEEVAPPANGRKKNRLRSISPPKDFQYQSTEGVQAHDASASGDKAFDDAVTAGLSGAGFDAAMAQANSSGPIEPEQEDYFPFKTSKKKGKKAKKSGPATPESRPEPEPSTQLGDVTRQPVETPAEVTENDTTFAAATASETPQQDTEDYLSYKPQKKGKKGKKRSSILVPETPGPEDGTQFPEESLASNNLDAFTDPSTAVSSELHQITREPMVESNGRSNLYDGHDYDYDLPADPMELPPSRRSKETEDNALVQLTHELERRRKESNAEIIQPDVSISQESSRNVEEEPLPISTPAEPEDEWAAPTKKAKKGKKGKKSKGEDEVVRDDSGDQVGLAVAGLAAGGAITAAGIATAQDESAKAIADEEEWTSLPSSKKKGKKGRKSKDVSGTQTPVAEMEREIPLDQEAYAEQGAIPISTSWNERQNPPEEVQKQERELSDALDHAEQGNPAGQYVTSAPAEIEPSFNEDVQDLSEAKHQVDDDLSRVQTAPVQPERWEDMTPPPESMSSRRLSDPEPSRRADVVQEASTAKGTGVFEDEEFNPVQKQSKKDKKSKKRQGLQPIRTDTEELFHEQVEQHQAQVQQFDEAPISAGERPPPPHIWVEPATTDRPNLIPRTTNGSEETGALMMAPPHVEDVAIEQSIKHSASREQLDSPIRKEDLKEMAEDDGQFTRVKKGKKKKGKKSDPSTPATELESESARETPVPDESAPVTTPIDMETQEDQAIAAAPAAVAPEEEWAPSKKKGKKGKKGKKEKEIAEPTQSAQESTRDAGLEEQDTEDPSTVQKIDALPELVSQPASTTLDDDWAVTSKKEGKKKGKKRAEPPTPAYAAEDMREEKVRKEDKYQGQENVETPPTAGPEDAKTRCLEAAGPTNANKVGSVFPHLQRVKRRTPSMDTAEQSQKLQAVRASEEDMSKGSTTAPQATWGFQSRDSGFGTESPIIYQEPEEDHDAIRDSGYHDPHTDSRYHRASTGGQTDITEIEDVPSHDYDQVREEDYAMSGIHESYLPQREARQSPVHTGTSTSSGNPLRVSVEVDPDWDLSVSKQRASVATSVDASELSPVRQSSAGEGDFHEQNDEELDRAPPSPVDSTSKQRTSYLFNTPPSIGAKGSKSSTPRGQTHSKRMSQEQESPIPDTTARKRSHGTEDKHDASMIGAATGAVVGAGVAAAAAHSLFGPDDKASSHDQPAIHDTPMGARSSGYLEPIEEHSPEDSHLNKRAMSDTGSPDREVKSARRSKTPQQAFREKWVSPSRDVQGQREGGTSHHGGRNTLQGEERSITPLSTDELIDRLSWPPVDEEHGTVGIDRVLSGDHTKARQRAGDDTSPRSQASAGSIARIKSPAERIRSPGSFSNASWHSDTTPPLRRSSRQLSGDLRAMGRSQREKDKQRSPAKRGSDVANGDPPLIGPSDYDRVRHKGKARAADMSDVYVSPRASCAEKKANKIDTNALCAQEGTGAHPGSPMSPTRPPSIRKRQSMHIIELEQRLDQIISENRILHDAKSKAEEAARESHYHRDVSDNAIAATVQEKELELRQRDAEIHSIKELLSSVQAEVARLSEVNEGLTRQKSVGPELEEEHRALQEEHVNTQQQWEQDRQELANLRDQHAYLNTNMEDIMRKEITRNLEDREAEIRRLRDELQLATQQIRALQQQILDTKAGSSSDWLVVNDEDYFDTACQELCAHVQSWIKRFSKWSDHQPCRLSSDIMDEKIEARLDNAVLDGTDVDQLLADRTKRRDVFMSVVMTMIWEYVFTRYLFGMDREQRQKLKQLEKILSDVGPSRAVAQWRATTLTLLAQRPAFAQQKQQDTQAVAATVFDTLALLLPPPAQREPELRDSLLKVCALAVDLAIQMRCQRAEYIMLPPLQPEYDGSGELARTVAFNAALMHDRSADSASASSGGAAAAARETGAQLEARKAVVKIVLFPLVVKKGDDAGEGEDEIVVCPAQVLCAKEKGKRVVRVQSGAMDVDDGKSARSERTRASGEI
ncbi:MAG: hypothetical protein M1822_007305 [Bathelium mastoideum]|nr:MAG: hypothetical protein M1822_007305 [Bathelium mastoideum]